MHIAPGRQKSQEHPEGQQQPGETWGARCDAWPTPTASHHARYKMLRQRVDPVQDLWRVKWGDALSLRHQTRPQTRRAPAWAPSEPPETRAAGMGRAMELAPLPPLQQDSALAHAHASVPLPGRVCREWGSHSLPKRVQSTWLYKTRDRPTKRRAKKRRAP